MPCQKEKSAQNSVLVSFASNKWHKSLNSWLLSDKKWVSIDWARRHTITRQKFQFWRRGILGCHKGNNREIIRQPETSFTGKMMFWCPLVHNKRLQTLAALNNNLLLSLCLTLLRVRNWMGHRGRFSLFYRDWSLSWKDSNDQGLEKWKGGTASLSLSLSSSSPHPPRFLLWPLWVLP